jgi:hypothetical protein
VLGTVLHLLPLLPILAMKPRIRWTHAKTLSVLVTTGIGISLCSALLTSRSTSMPPDFSRLLEISLVSLASASTSGKWNSYYHQVKELLHTEGWWVYDSMATDNVFNLENVLKRLVHHYGLPNRLHRWIGSGCREYR